MATTTLVEFAQVRQKRLEETKFGGLTLRTRGTRRQIQRNDAQVLPLQLEIAALVIELWHADAAHHFSRCEPCVDRGAGIARAHGRVVMRLESLDLKLRIAQVLMLCTDFLQADDIGALA